MGDVLSNLKEATKSKSTRSTYSLDETLAIMAMFEEGLKVKQVAELTGRSVHSLRYKFLEGEITNTDGSKQTRSVKQYDTAQAVFEAFGETYVDEADVARRIQEFKNTLASRNSVAV